MEIKTITCDICGKEMAKRYVAIKFERYNKDATENPYRVYSDVCKNCVSHIDKVLPRATTI